MPKSTSPVITRPARRLQPGRAGMDTNNSHEHAINAQSSKSWPAGASLNSLPTEIRIEIWLCAIQPRLIFLHELLERPQNFTLPAVTQVNPESRSICLPFYDRVEQGPCFQFSKDIFVCDPRFCEEPSNDFLDTLALRVQRLAFWDCFPDDHTVACPTRCENSLWSSFGRKIAEPIRFSDLWFPNLKELWVVKVGDIDKSWGIQRDKDASRQAQFRQLARQFRYWVKDGILEMAPLDLAASDTKFLLRNGRCRENHCQQTNQLRPMMVSRVMFMDQPYHDRKAQENVKWVRVEPRKSDHGDNEADIEAEARRVRWTLVERVLFFMLRSYCAGSNEHPTVVPVRARTIC